MLVKHKHENKTTYLNFDKVISFEQTNDNSIKITLANDYIEEFHFASAEQRDKAMEKIAHDYSWQRTICNLD